MLSKEDIQFAFTLSPEEAVKFFKEKGIVVTDNWKQLWDLASAKAFTVAGLMQMDMLQSIKSAVDLSISKGITYEEFMKQLKPFLEASGWYDKLKNPDWRMRLIFEQNVQSSYQAGRYRQMLESSKTRPYWKYVSVMDSGTTSICRSLNGKVLKSDDPQWSTIYPPNHFRCRSIVTSYSLKQMNQLGLEVATNIEVKPAEGFTSNPSGLGFTPKLDKYSPDISKPFLNGSKKYVGQVTDKAVRQLFSFLP